MRAIFGNTDFDDSNLQVPLANAFPDDCLHDSQVKDFPEIVSDVASKPVFEKRLVFKPFQIWLTKISTRGRPS